MKKLILIAGVAALAACAESATEETVEENVMVADEASADTMMAPDGGPIEGSYEVTTADGTKRVTTISADGTYIQVQDGQTIASGTMTMQDEDTACFDAAGDDEGPVCYDSEIGEDGTWTSKGPDGDATVVRVES